MSAVSIVVLSVLAAILGIGLITTITILIYLLLRLHRHVDETLSTLKSTLYDFDKSFRSLVDASSIANQSLSASLTKSLTDHSSTLQLISTSIGATLDTHRSKVDAQISKIRGEEISSAVKQFLEIVPKQAQIASRVEKAVILFVDAIRSIGGEFEISGSAIDRARQSGLGPEDYAPEDRESGQPFFSRSRTAAGDAIAIDREADDNSGNGIEPHPSGIPAFDDE